MSSRAREREAFLYRMAQEGVPLHVARKVMRAGATLHRLAELSCSSEAADRDRVPCPASEAWKGVKGIDCLCDQYGGEHQTVPRIDVQEWHRRRHVEKVLAPYGVVAVFSGDPRGAVLKLKVPSGATDDWGRVGLCVPA